ncbi:MAG: carboxypeptidase regulatory-like domain-containing protein [Kiritimatiellae bacterium]|nr:carboxypeptidase regulatory-like domain-containing protein [Kiritimatiellia bacterium]
MMKRFCMAGLLCLLAFAVISSAVENEREAVQRKADEDKMVRIGEALKKQDVEIAFYGRVIDQNQVPVEGASDEVQITQFSPVMDRLFGQVKSVSARTDATGSFTVGKEKGRSLYVKSVSKPGYEYIRSQNANNSFQFARHGGKEPFVAAKTAPVVFRLRKKGEMVFCFEVKYWDSHVYGKESGQPKGYDFIRQEPLRDLAKPVLDGEALACDLKVKATFNTNDATWTAVLSPGNTNGGIIVSEQLLYEAPDAGYQPEYTFTPEDRKPVKAKYVYLKSRDPAIFTRLEIEQINANKDFFRLSGKSVTNPYGDRNLEQATDLPYEVTKQLTDEAKTAFRQNKRPTKPDLPKLVKEAKERADEGKP